MTGKTQHGMRASRLSHRARNLLGSAVVAVTAVAACIVSVNVGVPSAHADAPAAALDGSATSQAAPSCWAIKQLKPTSPDGVYWLQTPALVAPGQFYCDMTTDGGGWVLIGRGREGWTWSYNGQGSEAALRNTPSGTGAFAPATLPATTVQALLGSGRVDALPDGIRVKRSTNTAGTTSQEMRILPSNRANWTWSLGGGVLFSSIKVGNSTFGSGNTQSWGADQSFNRLTTNEAANHNYKKGLAFGTSVAGQNNASSYLWTYTNEKSALPFSQIFIRPKLTTSSFTPITAAGLPASTQRSLMSSQTSTSTPWGVTGISGAASELNMEVETFAQIGNVMYVGGGFQNVQKGANPGPGEKIAQPWLAGFDVNTGEWLSSFRPALNNRVWDLQATPDGKLIVGGEFSAVNGVSGLGGLTELDPITGAIITSWSASVTWVSSDGLGPQVKSMDLQDGWLYIGGRFNHVTGGTPVKGPVTVGRAARLRISDGQPDGTWKPNFDGSVIELDASAQGDRVYFSGYFDNVNGTPSKNIGIVSTAAGAANITGLAPWVPSIGSGSATYQQAIKEDGNLVWQGGSEHILGLYDRNTYQLLNSSITKAGGDFQAIGIVNGVVYATCHCGDWTYSNDLHYDNPIPYASDVNNIQYIGAWDEATGAYLPEFYPSALDTRSGLGGWELTGDSNGCLWFGGDFKQGSFQDTGYQWLGGFGKFCPRDSVAPSVPANLRTSAAVGGTKLAWDAASDNSGSVSYEILRNDRVIATTTGVSYIDTTGSLPANYWVRAIDPDGNRSATSNEVSVLAADTTAPTVSITSPTDGSNVYGSVSVSVDANDDRGVASVKLSLDGTPVGTSTAAPYSFTVPITAVGSHTLSAVAADAAGNTATSTVTVTVPADTTAPTAPDVVSQTGVTTTSSSLTWSAGTDDRGVAGYQIVRDGNVIGQTTGLTYQDSPLTAGTTYSYTVRTVDATGNISADSAPLLVTTDALPSALFSDSWTGADGDAWQAAWTSGSVNGTVDTQAGAGRIANADVASAYARTQLTGLASRSDSELLTSFAWSSNTAASYLSVYLRGSGGWQNGYRPKNGYGLQLQSNSGTVVVQKNVNSVTTTLQSVAGAQALTTAKQWLRLRVSGSSIQFKIWTDGTPEPTTWKTTVADTSVTAPGQLFISLNRAASNVGAKSVTFDDLSINGGE